jgi:hypothetical protein
MFGKLAIALAATTIVFGVASTPTDALARGFGGGAHFGGGGARFGGGVARFGGLRSFGPVAMAVEGIIMEVGASRMVRSGYWERAWHTIIPAVTSGRPTVMSTNADMAMATAMVGIEALREYVARRVAT